MLEELELPVILVSAADTATANAVITDLIEDEMAGEASGAGGSERVWHINNKYYSARVRLRALGDDGEPRPARVQAHLVHVAAGEGAPALRRRVTRAMPAAAAAAVRLALCALSPAAPAAAEPPAPLLDAAHALRYEPVPLPAEPASEPAPAPGPFPELRGVARAREALHAHPWPGLRLHGAPAPAAAVGEAGDSRSPSDSSRSSDEAGAGEEDEDEEVSEAECVRRAELFAEALGALEAARELRAGAGGGASAGERLVRAEQLLSAFAAALGTDIDHL